jgi:protein-serine/threonine kinase
LSSDPFGGTFGIVKEGPVKYKEDGFGGWIWKTKYAVLRQNQLDFQKSEQGKVSFTIQLIHVTSVTRFDEIPLCIEIVRAANPAAHPGISLRDQPQKTMYLQFRRDEELYEWQDGIYTRCPTISGVSNPTNFSHRVHVGFDPITGGFLGLPAEWEKLLTASALTKEDYQMNPQAVIEVLEFYSDITKRAEHPEEYSSLMPTPPAQPNQNMQLGHGGGGISIAPPRPTPPSSYQSQQQSRYMSNTPPRSQAGTPVQAARSVSGPDQYNPYANQQRPQEPSSQSKLTMGNDMRRMMEEEAQRIKEQQERQRARDEAEQSRREMEAYNAAIPKKSTLIANQELGGYGASSDPRYNPSRAAPAAPSDRSRQQPQVAVRQAPGQRQAPGAPSQGGIAAPRPPYAQNEPSSRDQSPSGQSNLRALAGQQPRQLSPGARQPAYGDRNQPSQNRGPSGAQSNGSAPASRLPAPVQVVKPLNVASKTANGTNGVSSAKSVPDGVKQAELALTAKPTAAETRQKEVRMSSMSESEVMAKLKKIVTKWDPADSYVKQKKIGQGASGSVYIAKVRSDASSPVAKTLWRKDGAEARVAIKTMDLRHQPRKELIVNEIIVMKESLHPNIVNYLDSFLIENDSELWVIMEYMNGGALTDVIENNPNISEDQIAAICNEVCHLFFV